MTVKQAAERLEISERLCYELIAEGRLKCVRIGAAGKRGKIVIWEKHLQAFIETLEKATAKHYGYGARPH